MKCFVAGTPVLTPRGLIAIEDIKADDKVISTNTDTFEVDEKNVSQTFVRETNELVHLTINGEIISRKATDLDKIKEETFRGYLAEFKHKYAEGTVIRSNKYGSEKPD